MGYRAALAIVSLLSVSDLPVTGRVVSGPPPQVELTNVGTRAITAWTFAVVTPTPTGTHRETHSADVYLSEVTRDLPNAEKHLDWLRPGQSRSLPIDAAPPRATVEITAVVFDDGTGIGDPAVVASVFAQRAAERDELKKIVDVFSSAMQSKRGVAALQELQQRLAQPGGANESIPHRTAREAVNTWLQRTKTATSDADIDRSLQMYAEFVARQHGVATRHAERRGAR